MQLNLFDDGHLARNSLRENLKFFRLVEAIADLTVIGKTLNAPPNINEQISSLQNLEDGLAHHRQTLKYLGFLYQNFEESSLFRILGSDARFLKEGFARAACRLMNENHFDFIVSGLHPAELFLAVNDFVAAERSASSYLKQKEENAFVRQLQASALYKMGEETSALTAYTLSFFNNPRRCRANLILPPAYHHKFIYLLRKYEREESALLRLPFSLWQSGLTYIDMETPHFERLLQQAIRKNEKKARRDTVENILQFNRLLYLAECERLRLGRQNSSDKLHDLQQAMKALSDERFAVYINVLKSFRNL